MFCPKCGAQIGSGSTFCPSCGADTTPATKQATDETVVFTPVIDPSADFSQIFPNSATDPQPGFQPEFPTAYQSDYPTEPEKSGNGGRVALIVAICVLILGLLTTVVILFLPSLIGTVDDIDDNGSNRRGSNKHTTSTSADSPEEYTVPESNPYYIDFVSEDSYVLSASNAKYYSRSELSGMTRQQLFLAERELFARHGGTFTDGDLAQFFNAKSWYTPDSPADNFNESLFSDTERVNLLLLRALLMERDGTSASNPYCKLNNDVEGWILNFTDTSRITKDDIINLSEKEVVIAYNEILARKGYIFDDDELQLYFSGKNWYVPTLLPGSFNKDTELGEIERENYSCLQKYESKLKGVRFSAGNKFKDVYTSYMGYYLFPTSDSYKISPYDLQYMDAEELSIARNEIYARHGYSYNNSDFVEYFANCSWYYPTVETNRLDLIHLSDTEEYNVKIIQAFELNEKLKFGKGDPNTKMSYYAKHDYMTMYLPEHWRDNCICIKPTGLSGSLEFYEKYNEEKGYGWVFTMDLVPTTESIPSYSGCHTEVYGTVTTPGGTSYYVLKITPTYREDRFLEHIYSLMLSQVDTIFASIEWKSGYSFTPA